MRFTFPTIETVHSCVRATEVTLSNTTLKHVSHSFNSPGVLKQMEESTKARLEGNTLCWRTVIKLDTIKVYPKGYLHRDIGANPSEPEEQAHDKVCLQDWAWNWETRIDG